MLNHDRSRPLLLLAGAAASLALACSEPEVVEAPPVVRPVKLLAVGGGPGAPGPGTAERSFPGRVEAANQVDLSFRIGGPLVALPAREGQQVRRGQLLARVDPRGCRAPPPRPSAPRPISGASRRSMRRRRSPRRSSTRPRRPMTSPPRRSPTPRPT